MAEVGVGCGDGVPEPPSLQAVRKRDAIPVRINTDSFVPARIQFLEYDLDL
jgi:hypothetical protein